MSQIDVSNTKGAAFERRHKGHDDQPKGTRSKRGRAAARAHVGLRPMRFHSLHHHTTFSYLDGFQLPEAHVRRATEINMQGIAFTEHGNVSSHVKAERAAEKLGVKCMFGCELYTGRVGKNATQRKYHLTVLAKDAEGYRNLLQLVSKSYSEGFYHEPTVSWDMLKRFKRGLIILSGCQGSLLFCSAVGGKLVAEEDASEARALRVARRFKQEFGDNYFIEVQAFPQLDKSVAFNPIAERIARKLRIGLVASKDCHYTVPEEAEIQKVLHNVRPGNKRTLEDQVRDWGYTVPLCPPPTDGTIYRQLVGTGLSKQAALEAIANTELIAQDCNVTLPKLPMLTYPVPPGFSDAKEYWRHLLKEGWRYRGFHKLPAHKKRQAKAMLRKEMRIIEGKNFYEYLLTVRDGIVFAKDYAKPPFEHGIPVGPARGSAAASVCCSVLRITEVNPLMFPNLVFERFIDVTREDPPDIDTDFASEGRSLVRDFYVAKYGQACVNNIGTFSYYKSRLALDDVAKVHRIPDFKVETVKDLLIERSSGDLRASATIEDTVEQFDAAGEVVDEYPELRKAMDLEGNVKQFGVHAAGLVVSNGDIRDVCAVYEREIKGELIQVVSMDKFDAERQGLLKLDFLALKTMDMIAEALRQLDMKLTDLYDVNLEDPAVLAAFKRNDVVGIFQFDGRAARFVNGALKPDNFIEVCDVIALCRPGPLHSGAANKYIDTKHGEIKPEHLHPALDDITKATHSQIVYQEQILQVVTRIGNFDWTHASHIRRIISKKLGQQEFNREWERFWKGAKTLHKRSDYEPVDIDVARAIWGSCITAGAYAFNFAHCASYGILGAWAQWLKQHHPPVFYASALAKMDDKKPKGQKQDSKVRLGYHVTLMRDAMAHDIKLKPPHPQRSEASWRATGQRVLRAGFEQVPGVGPDKAQRMAELQPRRSWDDFLAVQGVGDGTVNKLRAFAASDDPFRVHKLDAIIRHVSDECLKLGLPKPTHSAADVPYQRGQDTEVVWVGVVVSRNLRDIFESHRARTGEELDEAEVKRPDLNELGIMDGYDGTETIRIKINRFKYPRFRDVFWKLKVAHDVVVVRGIKPGWRAAREIYVNQLWVVDPED
jgi:DNA polymerase-3 subunit alpha